MPAFPMRDMEPDTTPSDNMDQDMPTTQEHQDFRSNRAYSEPQSIRPESRAAKYHKSRIFGQTHRNNERVQEERLAMDNQLLRQDHTMLSSLLTHSPMADDWRTEPGVAYAPLTAGAAVEHDLSSRAASVLGVHAVTPAVAMALLEVIALRRNVIGGPRRRAGGRKATNSAALEPLFQRAYMRFLDEFEGHGDDGRLYAAQQFRILSEIHRNWAMREGAGDIFEGVDEEEIEVIASDDDAKPRRRRKGCGPRRCTRCKKIKNAGSGHGRSNCDDGVSVALDVPYPAPPGWRSQIGNGTRNGNS